MSSKFASYSCRNCSRRETPLAAAQSLVPAALLMFPRTIQGLDEFKIPPYPLHVSSRPFLSQIASTNPRSAREPIIYSPLGRPKQLETGSPKFPTLRGVKSEKGNRRIPRGTTAQRVTALLTAVLMLATVVVAATPAGAANTAGEVFTWGENGRGQLGDGTTTDRANATDVGLASISDLSLIHI